MENGKMYYIVRITQATYLYTVTTAVLCHPISARH